MTLNESAIIRESWNRTLDAIPTVLGKLAYLASLRDPNNGAYQHFGLAQKIGAGDADRTLSQSHVRVFQEWLCLGIQQQKDDAAEYLRELGPETSEIISNWLRLAPYQNWIPASSREAERQLFNADLGIVSELIRSEFGVSSPDRDL